MRKTDLDMKIAGTISLEGTVCLTDPCYDDDVWCRINDVKVVPGEYECIAWVSDEGEWGKRVAELGVYLDGVVPAKSKFDRIPGEVGVDAGLAGVYLRKPNFTDDEWIQFCSIIHDEWPTVHLHSGDFDGRLVGFTTSSGYGDGGYDAYAKTNNDGLAEAIEIVFL